MIQSPLEAGNVSTFTEFSRLSNLKRARASYIFHIGDSGRFKYHVLCISKTSALLVNGSSNFLITDEKKSVDDGAHARRKSNHPCLCVPSIFLVGHNS